jgi:hypothetical protein
VQNKRISAKITISESDKKGGDAEKGVLDLPPPPDVDAFTPIGSDTLSNDVQPVIVRAPLDPATTAANARAASQGMMGP